MPFSKNTKDAPTAVTNHVKDVANNACNIGFNSINDGIKIKISKHKYCNFKISNYNQFMLLQNRTFIQLKIRTSTKPCQVYTLKIDNKSHLNIPHLKVTIAFLVYSGAKKGSPM